MLKSIRREDAENHARYVKALRDDAYGAHPELSIEQIAAAVTRGGDDSSPVSLDTLQAALTGTRKLPAWKTGYMKRVIEYHTGRAARATIDEICRQAGGLYVEIEGISEGTVLNFVRDFSDSLRTVCPALADGTITDEELPSCVTVLRGMASTTFSLLAYIESRHEGDSHA